MSLPPVFTFVAWAWQADGNMGVMSCTFDFPQVINHGDFRRLMDAVRKADQEGRNHERLDVAITILNWRQI